MLTNLFLTNFHFIFKVFAALVLFFVSWLHLDSWRLDKKSSATLLHFFGFSFLCIAAIVFATNIEQPQPTIFVQSLKVIGLVFIIFGTLTAPKLSFPDIKNLSVVPLALVSSSLTPLVAGLYFVAAITFFKKVKLDRDKQLRKVGYAFIFFFLSEVVNITFFWAGTSNVFWSTMLANFGVVAFASRILQFIGIVILGVWAWGYIRFRAQIQLFAIFTTASLTIFLTTTLLFTGLLLKSIESDALNHLETDVKVLDLRLESLKFQSLANAKAVSADHNVDDAIAANDVKTLDQIAANKLVDLEVDFLDLISSNGNIITSATNVENRTESFIGNDLFTQALDGKSFAGLSVEKAVLAPTVKVDAFSPIDTEQNGEVKIVGAVSTGAILDSAFVDSVKSSTGLDVSIYGGDQVSATTFVNSSGERSIGLKMADQNVVKTVLQDGNIYTGKINLLDEPYYATFAPLKDFDGKDIGMIFVGKPQRSLLQTATRSIELTFIGAVILIILSTIPAFFFAKFINKNMKA